MNITAIAIEVNTVRTSLLLLQSVLQSKLDLDLLLATHPAIAEVLDQSLIGCVMLFSCLEKEMKKVAGPSVGSGILSWRKKTKVVWKYDVFKELLDAIRGQQQAIGFLLQLLQM